MKQLLHETEGVLDAGVSSRWVPDPEPESVKTFEVDKVTGVFEEVTDISMITKFWREQKEKLLILACLQLL
jgi:hypothetical protein